MNISEVSEILGLCHALVAPQHVFITEETLIGKMNHMASFRGLQPRARGDVIFLGKDADSTTPIHETLHAQFGFEEALTVPLTRIIHRKYEIVSKFPLLKNILMKPIKYKECFGDCEFPVHGEKYKNRVRHYVRVK